MANIIRIKRRASGGSTGAPASLANAELAYNESDAGNGVLYYGYGTGGAGGSATQVVAIGGDGAFVNLTGSQTISGNKTFTGTLTMSGATIDGFSTTGNVTIGGNFTVNGTTTTVNSTTISVDDKNIELGSVTSPTDITADGGGILLKGDTDKTIYWVNATDAWTSSEHIAVASGKSYFINNSNVLSSSALGSGVTTSSLTSVGTLTSGIWSASTIAVDKGGTGQSSYTNGQLLIGNTTGNTLTKATLTAGSGISITNGNGSITIESTGVSFAAGDGLDLVGGTLSVDLKANGGLVIESTELALDLGASSITGTLTVADGGTGATTLTGILKGNGTSAFTAAIAGTDYLDTNSTVDGGTF
jgi:hypothetical protein